MSFLKRFDDTRRAITHGITKYIGKTADDPKAQIENGEVKRILVSRPNARLGNLLLLTPLIQELTKAFPGCKIDFFVKGGLAPILFQNYEEVDKVISLPKKPFKNLGKYILSWTPLKQKKYDLVINVINTSSSGRISTQLARAKYKIFGNIDETFHARYEDSHHMGKFPVYLLREALVEAPKSPVPNLDLKLESAELQKGKQLLDELVDPNKKTISIFTYATGDKCYSKEWWDAFYSALLEEFPDYNIVEVLPVENISMISFKAPSFYSKDVREIGAFIANTAIFIGADSGIMHLASASGADTVGLFSSTAHHRYGPFNGNSFSVETTTTSNAEAIEKIRKVLDAKK